MSENNHSFIFQPGEWLGQGRVSFSASPEEIKFFTLWRVKEIKNSIIECTQIVEMKGVDEHVINSLLFFDISPKAFKIDLKNDLFQNASGKGLIDERRIAWEFTKHDSFEGFEVFELIENGDYLFHAEYSSPDQFRTIINGKIWKKMSDEK